MMVMLKLTKNWAWPAKEVRRAEFVPETVWMLTGNLANIVTPTFGIGPERGTSTTNPLSFVGWNWIGC